MSDDTGRQSEIPSKPASGDAAQERASDIPERSPDPRAYPRWATASWWWVVTAVEVAVLAVLGHMASGDRYPLVKTYRWPASDSYIVPITPSETVGAVILVGVLIGLAVLSRRPWWKLALAVGLAVALTVAVFLFQWGSEERLSFDLPLPFSPLEQAFDTCREQYPAAAEEAVARWRVPDECRNIWLNATTTTTTTTTTLPPIQTRRAELQRDLEAEDRAALEALGDTYDILARALDDNEQTAILAYLAAEASGNQDLENTAQEVMARMLDDLDRTAIQLVYDTYGRLREQLDSKQLNFEVHDSAIRLADPWRAINRYLSVAQRNPSDFDRLLDAMGFNLNMTEVNTLLEALN